MKKKTWIIIICVALAICAVAACLWFFLLQSQTDVLYFNLDGYIHQDPNNTAISNRKPDAGGVYRIDFIADGSAVTCTTSDAELVNRIDSQQVLVMQVSGNGQIRSVSAPPKPLADREFIQQISDNELVLNTSFAFNGKQTTIRLAEGCRFYDLSNDGADSAPELMDKVIVYGNALGQATDVFIVYRAPYSKLYWRLDRKYNSQTDATTRQPDANGVFTVSFAVDGQHVELKCKDPAVMADIDAPASSNAAMGLVLDEEGYITQMLPPYRAIRGREMCNMYDVTAIDGNRITVMCKQQGSLYGLDSQIILSEDCQFFDVSDGAALTGQAAQQLQVGDRVTVYADPLGMATHVFIQIRVLEGPLYFNVLRLYNNNHTARRPDGDGWYSFGMLCDGKLVTLKTQDSAIADQIDSYAARGMGLKLNGDVIEGVYDVSCVTGNGVLANQRYVQSFSQSVIIAGNAKYTRLNPLLLYKDCKVYDVSGYAGAPIGEETTLRPGDCFIAFGNADNLATHIFVLSRKK